MSEDPSLTPRAHRMVEGKRLLRVVFQPPHMSVACVCAHPKTELIKYKKIKNCTDVFVMISLIKETVQCSYGHYSRELLLFSFKVDVLKIPLPGRGMRVSRFMAPVAMLPYCLPEAKHSPVALGTDVCISAT